MKKQPIHQNLNTSFVNVAALVRYLRRLQFVGSIRVELSSYEADIVFTSSNAIQAREYDHIAGRIAHGENALQRILIRCKEPHGRINVYKAVEGYAGTGDGPVFVDKSIVLDAREMAASAGGRAATEKGFEFVFSSRDRERALVLAALSEILGTFDEVLAKENLSFTSAFQNACDSIADAYPFMEKNPRALVYKNGAIRLSVIAEPHEFTSAVFAALKPIFGRLRGESKYELLVRSLADGLRASADKRRSEYVRLGLTKQIEELLSAE